MGVEGREILSDGFPFRPDIPTGSSGNTRRDPVTQPDGARH